MSTMFASESSAQPGGLYEPSLHDHLSTMLLAKAIPFLEYVEYGTRTSLELRNLIKQAKAVTKE